MKNMYSKLTRLIVLFAMLASLPSQGLAAVTMPFCQAHGETMAMHADGDQAKAVSHCGDHDAGHKSGKVPCDKCLACHLSTAQAIIQFALLVNVAVAAQEFSGMPSEKPQSISSSLFRPPILAFA